MSDLAWGSQYDDVDVLCPFYAASSRKNKAIRCEGIITRTKQTIRFARRGEMISCLSEYCMQHYKRCPYYRQTAIRYEEAEE
jgi:hypothetical protein